MDPRRKFALTYALFIWWLQGVLQRQTYVERFMFDTVGENMALKPSEIALNKRMCFPAWLVK